MAKELSFSKEKEPKDIKGDYRNSWLLGGLCATEASKILKE